MKFFEELFSGQLHPIEEVTSNNPEYKLKAKELALYSARLEGALTEEQKELLWQYRDTHSDITNILQTEAYRIGVIHGMKIKEELESGGTFSEVNYSELAKRPFCRTE